MSENEMVFPSSLSSSREPPWNASGLSPGLSSRLSDGWGQTIRWPGRFPDGAPGIYPGPVSMSGGYPSINMQTPWPNFGLSLPNITIQYPNMPLGQDPTDTVEEGGGSGGGSGSDGQGVEKIVRVGSGDTTGHASLLQNNAANYDGTSSDVTAYFRTIKTADSDNLTVTVDADTIILTAVDAAGTNVSSAANDGVDVTGNAPDGWVINGVYAPSPTSGSTPRSSPSAVTSKRGTNNFMRIGSGSAGTGGLGLEVRLFFGIGKLTSSSQLSGTNNWRWEYNWVRIAGDLPDADSGSPNERAAYNLAEVDWSDCESTSPQVVGGVNIKGVDYPSAFQPKAVSTADSDCGDAPFNGPMVFMWFDVDGILGAHVPSGSLGTQAYWFQLLTPHDGTCT